MGKRPPLRPARAAGSPEASPSGEADHFSGACLGCRVLVRTGYLSTAPGRVKDVKERVKRFRQIAKVLSLKKKLALPKRIWCVITRRTVCNNTKNGV